MDGHNQEKIQADIIAFSESLEKDMGENAGFLLLVFTKSGEKGKVQAATTLTKVAQHFVMDMHLRRLNSDKDDVIYSTPPEVIH